MQYVNSKYFCSPFFNWVVASVSVWPNFRYLPRENGIAFWCSSPFYIQSILCRWTGRHVWNKQNLALEINFRSSRVPCINIPSHSFNRFWIRPFLLRNEYLYWLTHLRWVPPGFPIFASKAFFHSTSSEQSYGLMSLPCLQLVLPASPGPPSPSPQANPTVALVGPANSIVSSKPPPGFVGSASELLRRYCVMKLQNVEVLICLY